MKKSKSIKEFIKSGKCTKSETSPGLSAPVACDMEVTGLPRYYVSFMPEAKYADHGQHLGN
jgi:hypothetical protein